MLFELETFSSYLIFRILRTFAIKLRIQEIVMTMLFDTVSMQQTGNVRLSIMADVVEMAIVLKPQKNVNLLAPNENHREKMTEVNNESLMRNFSENMKNISQTLKQKKSRRRSL